VTITIVPNDNTYIQKNYKATIDLKGTFAQTFAPYGRSVGEPHVNGYGDSPIEAMNNAYRELGVASTVDIPTDEPEPVV